MPAKNKNKQKKREDNEKKSPTSPTPAPTTTTTTPGTGLPQTFPSTSPQSFPSLAEGLLPFFSKQDQQSVSTFLHTQDPTGKYKDYLGQIPAPGSETATPEARQKFMASSRADEALTKLDQMRTASNLTEEQLGPGYKFLKQAVGLLKTLGTNSAIGEQGMTRAEYESMQAQLSSLMSQGQADKNLAPYAELAQKFLNPTLIGELNPSRKSGSQTIYGQANQKLFA